MRTLLEYLGNMGEMEAVFYWVCEISFMAGGVVYAGTMDRRENFWKRIGGCAVLWLLMCCVANMLPLKNVFWIRGVMRIPGFGLMILFLHSCWVLSWSAAIYYAIWAFMSWQLIYEVWLGIAGVRNFYFSGTWFTICLEALFVFAAGYLIVCFTIG
ncbi:MAG: hypothetical protein J6C37_12875, partial [Roseburia sp.]|nr:hypothetical protein [Roseburia sp.]